MAADQPYPLLGRYREVSGRIVDIPERSRLTQQRHSMLISNRKQQLQFTRFLWLPQEGELKFAWYKDRQRIDADQLDDK